MDNKPWLWRKKSAEKNVVASDKSSKGNEDEVQTLLAEKAELENGLIALNDRLSSALSDCSTKDELVKKHAKMAQESIKGWEKAEEEAASLKLQLDEALQQRFASEERISHLDAALKECMQQLRFVREEQEQRIHDAVAKTSREFEKSQMVLEEKLVDTSKRLAKMVNENSHLGKTLLLKEKLIEELNRHLNQVEADFGSLMARLEATEKDNGSFKYEVRVLEKELEIRNEEREFNRRTAEASHRQHLESVKKIAKLEAECQRLRLLVRKRLPGPGALAKMKNEVEMLGRDSVEMRRKSSPTGLMFDSLVDNSCETPNKRISILTEQLYAMEEENRALREVLVKRTTELQSSRNMYATTTPKRSQLESQLLIEPATKNSLVPHELSLSSMSEIGSDDKASCAESWASALISELEHFRVEKQKGLLSKRGVGASDMNLMDDFVEMERLAVVSVDRPSGGSHVSSNEVIPIASPLENECSNEIFGVEIVPVSDSESGFSAVNQEIRYSVNGKFPVWLQETLKLVLDQKRVTGRSFQEILEDIRAALDCNPRSKSGEHVDASESLNHLDASDPSPLNISKSDTRNQQVQPDQSKSICRMIELIEGLSLPSPDYDNDENCSRKNKSSDTPEGYTARVLQWKTSELSGVLQKYVHACYNLLNGKADLDKFVQELTTALEWIINHCFSLQDVSTMRDAIIKECDWDDSRSEAEADFPFMHHLSTTDVPREQRSRLSSASVSNGHNIWTESVKSTKVEERRKSKDELMEIESSKKELEGKLQSAADTSDRLKKQLQDSEKMIESLQTELHELRKEKEAIEDQIEHQKMTNEDLDTQLTVTRGELNEARQQFSSIEVELENKNNCFEELQATCVELQLQLESVKQESPKADFDQDQEEKKLRTDREITAASEKLAECQETILHLGKQLKALSTPKEAALFDKVITNPSDTKAMVKTKKSTPLKKDQSMSLRTSLLDQMLAEDDSKPKIKSPETKEIDSNSTAKMGTYGPIVPLEKILGLDAKTGDENATLESKAIVPTKKHSAGSLWRKLLWRKKKGNTKKTQLSLAS